jgi:hypothetical protein
MRLAALTTNLRKVLGGQAVPMLSIAGNTFTCIDGDNTKVVSEMDDDGLVMCPVIFVDGNPNLCKIFYKEDFDPKADDHKAPDCFSDDGVIPAASAQSKQSETCGQCPKNVWGSKISKTGAQVKACQDFLKMAVVVPKMGMDKIWLFRVPPASLKNFFAYATKFDDVDMGGRKANLGDFKTYIYFEQGKQGIINFAPANLEPNEKGLAARIAEEGSANNIIGMHNVQSHHALEAPAQQKQLEAPKASKIVDETPKASNAKVEKPKLLDMTGMRTKSGKPKFEEAEEGGEGGGAKSNGPSGIPKLNMPEGLQSMINNIMNS